MDENGNGGKMQRKANIVIGYQSNHPAGMVIGVAYAFMVPPYGRVGEPAGRASSPSSV